MKRPSTSTLIIGHPLVALPSFGVLALFGCAAAFGHADGMVGVLVLFMAAWLQTEWRTAARYRAALREWNALDPNYRPARPIRATLIIFGKLLIAAPIVLGCGWLLINFDDPSTPAKLITFLLAGGVPALWLAAFVLSRRKRRPRPQHFIVTQAISRPLPAPSAAEAYASLPDYCRPLFSSQRQEPQ
jgi:hypothetical protein